MKKSFNNTHKNILIISHRYYPAMMNPRAFRWTTLAEYWVSKGHNVDVLTVKGLELPERDIINGVNVIRTTDYALKIRSIFFGKKSKKETINDVKTNKKNHIKLLFLNGIARLHELISKNLFWPDKECLWIWVITTAGTQTL